MPIYEYHCDECGAEFEALVFTAQDIVNVVCTACNSSNVMKLMSAAAVGHGGGSASAGDCGSGPCDYNPRSHSCGGGCGCGG